MNGLSCCEESVTICSAVLIGCQRVTDGRDGQTDVKPIAITCFSIADAGKNCCNHFLILAAGSLAHAEVVLVAKSNLIDVLNYYYYYGNRTQGTVVKTHTQKYNQIEKNNNNNNNKINLYTKLWRSNTMRS